MHDRGNIREWLVYFDQTSALIVRDPSPEGARISARIQAWLLTGRWLNPIRVEAAHA